MDSSPNAAAAALPASSTRDAQLALWNALKLGASLVFTWGISLGVRFVLPRYLGPEQFGAYNFADAFAMTFFVFATVGADTYVQRELPVRPQHASDFFGGVLLLRVALSLLLIAGMWLVLSVTGRAADVRLAAVIFGVGQLFFVHNATFVAMLNARGTVDGMSVVNVLTKVSWGVVVLLAVLFHFGLVALAAAFVFSEALRSAALFRLCRKHLELRVRLSTPELRAFLWKCAPFFVTTLALTLYSRLDVTLVGFLTNDLELGWYSAATMVSNLGLLLAPLITAVLLPLFAKAKARSDDELTLSIRRSLEVVLMLAVPVSLALFVGADVWIRAVSGPGFEPGAMALRAIAPIFVLTYLAMLCASCLNLLDREWTVTRICLLGLAMNPVLNVALIRPLGHLLGPGGAGVGAALASVGTEAAVCTAMLFVIGRRTVDSRLVSMLLRTGLVCAAVLGLDLLLRPLGAWRVALDAVAYVGLALLVKAVRVDELRSFIKATR